MLRVPLLLSIALLALPAQPSTVRVTVHITGIRAGQGGVLHVAVHAAPGTGFPGQAGASGANRDVRVEGPEASVVLDVPAGDVAVAVHHDANANGRLDANFLGMPREGWAVSNDVRPRFRPPRFGESRVAVSRDTTVTVRMAY